MEDFDYYLAPLCSGVGHERFHLIGLGELAQSLRHCLAGLTAR
jgi:hypothetical protein